MFSKPNRLSQSSFHPFRQQPARGGSMLLATILVVVVVASSGCRDRGIQTGYGRAFGDSYSRSVNGTAVFHELVEASGHEVDRYRKFSPRWERYQTVFWFPDSFQPPSDEAIAKIENWLMNDSGRTLVYVARDYDAAETYWDVLRSEETDEVEKDDLSRQFFDATADHMLARQGYGITELDCSWFETVQHSYTSAEDFSGELVEGLDTADLDIRYRSLPSPGDVRGSGWFGDYDVTELMAVDDKPFIYSVNKRSFFESKVIVVGNSSFLLNLPMAKRANRELAKELVDYALPDDFLKRNVLFIENIGQLAIADKETPEQQSQWSWITKKPLRYIVPNILFCSLMFCFVYFPIFGRPKKVKQQSTSNFRDHIDALGQLIRNTNSRKQPREWIEEYRRRSGHSRSRQDNISNPSSSNQNENK